MSAGLRDLVGGCDIGTEMGEQCPALDAIKMVAGSVIICCGVPALTKVSEGLCCGGTGG